MPVLDGTIHYMPEAKLVSTLASSHFSLSSHEAVSSDKGMAIFDSADNADFVIYVPVSRTHSLSPPPPYPLSRASGSRTEMLHVSHGLTQIVKHIAAICNAREPQPNT